MYLIPEIVDCVLQLRQIAEVEQMEQRDAQMGSILLQIIEQKALIPEEQVDEVST